MAEFLLKKVTILNFTLEVSSSKSICYKVAQSESYKNKNLNFVTFKIKVNHLFANKTVIGNICRVYHINLYTGKLDVQSPFSIICPSIYTFY